MCPFGTAGPGRFLLAGIAPLLPRSASSRHCNLAMVGYDFLGFALWLRGVETDVTVSGFGSFCGVRSRYMYSQARVKSIRMQGNWREIGVLVTYTSTLRDATTIVVTKAYQAQFHIRHVATDLECGLPLILIKPFVDRDEHLMSLTRVYLYPTYVFVDLSLQVCVVSRALCQQSPDSSSG